MIGFTTSLGALGKKGLERATLSKGGRIALVRSARRVVVRKQETKYDEVMQKEQQEGSPKYIDDVFIPDELNDMEPDFAARLQTLAEDISSRPLYYANAGLVVLAMYFVTTALHGMLVMVNQVPLVQDSFETIGLIYLLWFLMEFVGDSNKRSDLLDRVDYFMKNLK